MNILFPGTPHYNTLVGNFKTGIALKWISISALIMILLWIGVWYWSMVQDIDRARAIIYPSVTIDLLFKRVQTTDEGRYFIDFAQGKGDSLKDFTEFRRLNAKGVGIYLGQNRNHGPNQ